MVMMLGATITQKLSHFLRFDAAHVSLLSHREEAVHEVNQLDAPGAELVGKFLKSIGYSSQS